MNETKKLTTIFCSLVLICLTFLGMYTLHLQHHGAFMFSLVGGLIVFIVGIYNITNEGG